MKNFLINSLIGGGKLIASTIARVLIICAVLGGLGLAAFNYAGSNIASWTAATGEGAAAEKAKRDALSPKQRELSEKLVIRESIAEQLARAEASDEPPVPGAIPGLRSRLRIIDAQIAALKEAIAHPEVEMQQILTKEIAARDKLIAERDKLSEMPIRAPASMWLDTSRKQFERVKRQIEKGGPVAESTRAEIKKLETRIADLEARQAEELRQMQAKRDERLAQYDDQIAEAHQRVADAQADLDAALKKVAGRGNSGS